jgi:aromatic amino acid aminotransferase I
VSQIDFQVPDISLPQNIIDNWRNDFSPSRNINIGVGQNSSRLEIPVGLQYGTGAGTAEMMDILQELNTFMHPNLPHNCVTLHSGSADGATKLFRLLADPGESLLVEEFSYPGITNSLKAMGAKWEPVKMDHLGLIPEDMDHILETWDENLKGRRPHVLYLIP